MDAKNSGSEPKEKNFRITFKKYSYGELSLIFLLLGGVFNMFSDKLSFESSSHFVTASTIFLTKVITVIPSLGFLYFLILWIMKLIRSRGKTERPENKKAKKIITIIFIILTLGFIVSVALSVSRVASSYKGSPEQTSFVNTLFEKFQGFSNESDGIKVAMQSFLGVVSNNEYSKFHESLKNLLSATQSLQPKIDELKIFSQQGLNLSSNEKEQRIFNLYLKAIDLRGQDNKKLTEMAIFGLTVDWENPTEAQMTKWTKLVVELGVIEKEIESTQNELQNI